MSHCFSRPKVFLALLSGALLGLAYPPVPVGITAFFAFIPFFFLFDEIESYGEAFRYSYIMLFVFNLMTVYWTGGFTHLKDPYLIAAGALLIVAHPLFFFVAIGPWIFIRRQFGFKTSLFAFPFLWVAYEYFRAHTEFSFPWLTLGNTQTYDLSAIQFASITGAYGISFWILWLNVLLFTLAVKIALKEWNPTSARSVLTASFIVLLYMAPKLYGSYVLSTAQTVSSNQIRLGVVQPNIDPFEKWERHADPQLDLLQRLTDSLATKNVDLIIWPETAVPFYILSPSHRPSLERIKEQVDRLHIPLLTGIPDIEYYPDTDDVPRSSKTSSSGQRYDTFNSSMLLTPGSAEIQKYAKMILVPFAERVPYSEGLSFLNAVQWNFGLGGWNVGREQSVFSFRTGKGTDVKFSNMICYESVYPGFVASFVRNGAQFLTVITNDSWWGNTSGAYQHKQIATLRAVENRRWVVQCANGGISCYIDPWGRIIEASTMYTQRVLAQEVGLEDELTYYTMHGDWFAEVCGVLTLLILGGGIGKKFYGTIRMRQLHEPH